MSTEIKENLEKIKYELNEEIIKLNIKRDIVLIAVSKTFPVDDIISAYNYGHLEFGENKVQEAISKIETMKTYTQDKPKQPKWHLIGHLQSNKVKSAVNHFDMIHSLDKVSTIVELSKRAKEINKTMDILIQVNTSFEDSKSGCEPESALTICETCLELDNIRLRGLMTIAPFVDDEHQIAKSFSMLRELRDKISSKLKYPLEFLSMGMSSDWKIALREGATHLRIGSAIFGKRNYN
jgi:hypothetical protein